MFWTIFMALILAATGLLIMWSFGNLKETVNEEMEYKRRKGLDKQDRVVKEHYESGALKKEMTLRNSFPFGIAREYYEDGRLKKAWNYMDGSQEYLVKEYDEEGVLLTEEYFKFSKLARKREYDKDGSITSEKTYKG